MVLAWFQMEGAGDFKADSFGAMVVVNRDWQVMTLVGRERLVKRKWRWLILIEKRRGLVGAGALYAWKFGCGFMMERGMCMDRKINKGKDRDMGRLGWLEKGEGVTNRWVPSWL